MPEEMPYLGPLDPRLENKAFREALEYYTRDFDIPEQPRILDVGCERSIDIEVLEEFFGGVITGINIQEEYIKKLSEEYTGNRHKFVHGDARKAGKLAGRNFDVVVVRNSSTFSEGQEEMFKGCYSATKAEGIIISTCYLSFEFPVLHAYIRQAGYEIRTSEHNRFACPVSDNPFFKMATDGFIVVGQKKQKTGMQKLWAWLNRDFYKLKTF